MELRSKTPRRRGMALVVVLMLLSIMGLLFGVTGNHQGLSIKGGGAGGSERDAAYFVSRGALQRALTELRNDSEWQGTAKKPFPGRNDALFDIEIFKNTSGAPQATPAGVDIPPNTTLVLATGRVGDTSRLMAGILGMANGGTSGFAGLAQEDFLVKGTRLDAFTTAGGFSRQEMQAVPMAAQIASIDGFVEITSGTVGGSVVDGVVASDRVDGDLDTYDVDAYYLDDLSSLGGETELTEAPALDDVAMPEYEGGSDISVGGGAQTILPGHYRKFYAGGDAQLFMEPGDYFFSDKFITEDQSKIVTNGPVRIFVDGQLVVGGTSALNFEGDPRDCEITITQSTAQSNYTAGNGAIWGRVRSNDSRFVVSGYLYGDLQAKSIAVYGDPDGSGVLRYFADLADLDVDSDRVGDFIYTSTWVVR